MKSNRRICLLSAYLAAGLVILGVLLDPAGVPAGLMRILTEPDILITDYLAVGGIGAALVNSGLVILLSIAVIGFSKDHIHGFTIAEIGLMAGFSLFGKNVVNILPIMLGTWLYAKIRKEPFKRYLAVALLSTALSPLVSWLMFGSAHHSVPLGALVGLGIGFVMPALSAYTFRILNGLNLYNVGFACGLLALMAVPILSAVGRLPLNGADLVRSIQCAPGRMLARTVSPLHNLWLCNLRRGGRQRFGTVAPAVETTGRAPSDYLQEFGLGPVLVNMGVNGLVGIAYIMLVGGTFSGPVVGGVLTMMAFSAYGKHLFNMVPMVALVWP